jgi:hypothetical protein
MILSPEELRSLVELTHQSPHTLLGMHPLGDGSGLVARALLPDAAKVEVHPTHEKDKPTFELKRIPKTDVFEAVTKLAGKVYAYDLVIKAVCAARAMRFHFCRHWANRICFCSAKAMNGAFTKNSARNCA